MANQILSELGKRLPQIALGILAARQGGPQAAAAFQAGMLERQQREEARTRQEQLDEERRQAQAAQETRMASADSRAASAEGRAAEDQKLQRVNSLMAALSQYDADPSALASMYGVPAEQATAVATPIVTARDKKRANDLLADLERSPLYKGYFQSPESLAELDEQNIVWKGAPIKIRDLRQIAEQTVTPKAVTPASARPDVPNTPEEQFYQRYASEKRAKSFGELPTSDQAAARKQWMQSDDRPQPQATVLIQTVDENGNPTQRFVSKTPGAEFAPAPSGTQQTAMAEQEAGLQAIASIEQLYKPEYVGPIAGRANKAKMAIPGADVPEDVAGFYAGVAALRNEIIKLLSGAAVSGNENTRMQAQLPDVIDKPSVFVAKLAQTKRNRENLLGRLKARSGQPAAAPKNPYRP